MYMFNDMFSVLDALMQDTFSGKKLLDNGLKSIIGKPHNLYVFRNKETNEIEKYKIEVCYTPFSKKDVKVSIVDGILKIKIGSENRPSEDGLIYKGISGQCSEISFKLADANIDPKAITAKCEDGILTIEMPTVTKQPETIEVTID